jgi:hypothetical protein
MKDAFYQQLFIVGVAVTLSQLSIKYLEGLPGKHSQAPVVPAEKGWSQLAFLAAQGRKGCLCCDESVMFLPEVALGVQVRTWKVALNAKIRNVTVPLDNGNKAVKRLYSSLVAYAREPGAAERQYDVVETDAYCIQACLPEGLFTFPFFK